MTPPDQPLAAAAEDHDDEAMFEMANLYPRTTGLPMTVWVSPRGKARHDARVKVSRIGGDRMVIEDAAVVAIRPAPALLEGALGTEDLAAVIRWIKLNQEALVEYWDGTADTADLVARLRRI
ncbi:DUF4160 domain-containing protein [Roseicella aquatilis]|uniref:DUF4160 domain-containing protein n=1 Tax=Roseicella aquatilis TaxID=2527868 RepID=A0A4V2WM68_9PROT|nr:DUF4160 domain-containing protein [Roseicella aquatilis]TCZ66700.1 DUF4160 domain-containing protein [Roseicella aquatilis]